MSFSGEEASLILDSPAFPASVGSRVALMGRAHPVGNHSPSILFGVLYQGGRPNWHFDQPKSHHDMIVFIRSRRSVRGRSRMLSRLRLGAAGGGASKNPRI